MNFLRTGEIECPGCLDKKFLLLEAEYYGIEGMVETIREEIESKEAYDAHMRKHWEEQNCIQQCCQNYLSQIANYTSRQVEEQRMINYNHPGKFLTMSTEFKKKLHFRGFLRLTKPCKQKILLDESFSTKSQK